MRLLTEQLKVIFALVMREMTTRYGRSAGGYIWAILEPAGFIAILSVIFSQLARNPPLGDDFPLFYATGYLVFHFYSDISSVVSIAVQFNKALFTFPKVSLIDAVLARFMLQTITCIFITVVILTPLLLITNTPVMFRFDHVLVAVAFAALIGFGVGSLNCVLFIYFQTWQRFFGIINRPMFLISGIFFLYEDMPRLVREILWWNPLIHLTSIMRSGFYPGYEPEFVSLVYVAVCALTPLTIGFVLLHILGKKILEAA